MVFGNIVNTKNLAQNTHPPKNFGGHSMVNEIKRILVRQPDVSFKNADPKKWNYTHQIDYSKALIEHADFVNILCAEGIEVIYHDAQLPAHADSIYVHDPVLITDYGAIILRMGKELRNGEEEAYAKTLSELNIPIIHELKSPSTAEGGDMLWLDNETLIIGRGFRTNQSAIDEISQVLNPFGIKVHTFDLTYDNGPQACLHLQSFISLVDTKTAVIFPKLMPVAFYQMLCAQNFKLIEVPENEYLTMGTNILTLKPKVCLALRGNTVTKERLEHAGCKVLTYAGNEISLKAEGGATCLTKPILRSHNNQ